MSLARLRTAAAENPVLLGAVVLAAAYLWYYLSAPDLPGNAPEGWWVWFDQAKTLESARALRSLDLSAKHHWYPPGYALLGVPFLERGFRVHPFVFVDLGCLLACYAGFVAFARACFVRGGVAAALFLVAALWDRPVFGEWSIPWNSTPAAALIWALLPLCAFWLAGRRRPVLAGLIVGALPFFRPTEALPAGVCVLWLLAADWRRGQFRLRTLLGLALGAAVALAPQVALHLAIYGPRPSEYMLFSREIGFTLHDFGWKAYVILADPYWWFTDGQGMLQRIPWMGLALAGFVPALLEGGAAGLLAAALAVHLVLYLSYIDLLPTGLWRFNNVHYWKWAIPGYAVLTWLLLRDLVRWPWSRASYAASAGLALLGVLSLIRIAPRPAAAGEPAKMLEFHGPSPTFEHSNFGEIAVRDALGRMRNVTDFRLILVPGGIRLIALRRDFVGDVAFQQGSSLAPQLAASVPLRFAERVTLGRPCWLAVVRCGRREVNPLLPATPTR